MQVGVLERRDLMRPDQRVVISMPLAKLWDDEGPVSGVRHPRLDGEAVRSLLREGPQQFVAAVLGHKRRRINPLNAHSFWKEELSQRMCIGDRFNLEEYPGERCYLVYAWRLNSGNGWRSDGVFSPQWEAVPTIAGAWTSSVTRWPRGDAFAPSRCWTPAPGKP